MSKKMVRFTFVVDQERAKVVVPLLLDYVKGFQMKEVDEADLAPLRPGQPVREPMPESKTPAGRMRAPKYAEAAALVVNKLRSLHNETKEPVHYKALQPAMMDTGYMAGSINPILSDLRALGRVRRVQRGYYLPVD